MNNAPRRAPIFGPELWTTFAGRDWCHFDRWFAVVATADFGGDLDALERELVRTLRSSLHGRRDTEAKLSHLVDLRARMSAASIRASELAAVVEPDKTTVAKARRKVLDQALEGRAMTDAMRATPRLLLNRRARYGHWSQFPEDPARWYDKLAGRRPSIDVSEGRSFAVVRQLSERLVRYDGPRRPVADRLALYRAFQTVGVELAERGDDSYGNIGQLRLEAFTTYLGIDWPATDMAPEHYWQDLCELLVSDDYALTYRHETLPFQRVRAAQAEMIEAILLGLAYEYRAAYQDYQADEALELVAWLHIAGHRYTAYTDSARRLGSNHWMPIDALAASAMSAGRHDLALSVFHAADQPGMHRDHLRARCFELTGVELDEPQPYLRVVE